MVANIQHKVKQADRRAFLATGSAEVLTIHTLTRAADVAKIDGSVQFRHYSAAQLFAAGSLEGLCGLFGNERVLYDPTSVVRRSRGIVRLAAAFRRAARRDIGQIAFEPRSRTLYVQMTPENLREQDRRIGRVLGKLADAARSWQTAGIDCHVSVRLCSMLPAATILVPVDRQSLRKGLIPKLVSAWRQVLGGVGLSTAFATAAVAQAVDKANVTTSTGVTVSSAVKGDFGGQVALPIAGSLGASLDIAAGTDGYIGGGAQLFLRDPELGLIGLTGSVEALDEKVLYRLGAKTEFYLKSLTLGGSVGLQTMDNVDENPNGVYGGVDLSFYATPDFALRGGAELSPDLQLFSVGAEWRPGFDALPGLSIYSDFEHGNDGENAAKVGLIYHFGEDGMSLIERDRRQTTSTTIMNRHQLKYVS